MHGIVKPTSTTTKLRIVFDASAPSQSGMSLNDSLLVGPTTYPPLNDILLKFRLFPIALTADILKMFRAIELHENDWDFHLFVWKSEDGVLRDFRMKQLTFRGSIFPLYSHKNTPAIISRFSRRLSYSFTGCVILFLCRWLYHWCHHRGRCNSTTTRSGGTHEQGRFPSQKMEIQFTRCFEDYPRWPEGEGRIARASSSHWMPQDFGNPLGPVSRQSSYCHCTIIMTYSQKEF